MINFNFASAIRIRYNIAVNIFKSENVGIFTSSTFKRVFALTANERVVAVSSIELIISISANKGVVTIATIHDVFLVATDHGVVTTITSHGIRAIATNHDVIIFIAIKDHAFSGRRNSFILKNSFGSLTVLGFYFNGMTVFVDWSSLFIERSASIIIFIFQCYQQIGLGWLSSFCCRRLSTWCNRFISCIDGNARYNLSVDLGIRNFRF